MTGSSPDPVVRIWVDGASRNNPGPAAAGWVVVWGDEPPAPGGRALGTATNNQAEYQALLLCLEQVIARGARRVHAQADSELLVRQVQGTYKVRHPNLKPLHARIRGLISRLDEFRIRHVPREENRDADRAANLALDGSDRE